MYEQNVTLGPGTGTFTQHTFEILIMLLGAFLIGLWLGWALWAKYKQQIDRMILETQSLNVTTDALRAEMSTLKTHLATVENDSNRQTSESIILNSDNAALRDKILALENELAVAQVRNRQLDTELALSLTPETPIADDIPMEIVAAVSEPKEEPKTTAPAVALAENTPAPSIIEPVALAEPEKKKTASKKTDPKIIGAAAAHDDLAVIEGIGPKIQMLLNQYGIYTYRQLAETDVERLKEILQAAGSQLAMHDPGTWPSQANLAANDQWDTLKSVQGFLKGGKKPD